MPTLPEGTIEAHHLWKRFRADQRYSKLRYEMKHISARLRGGGEESWRWALRDVDLHIAPGEAVGLVGANGSGKSTLLKVLCRVMRPHSGTLEVSGRVGALIEVVAGIHPDLSGRENAFLYGTLLGLDRRAVAGMKMRLGFAVAAFLEPDVLLVDEVLAVGDAAFQQKCLERMRIVLNQGSTLVFVSHDLAAMEATCERGVWLRDGVAELEGPIRPILAEYRHAIESEAEGAWVGDGPLRIAKVEALGPDGPTLQSNHPVTITMRLESDEDLGSADVFLGISEGAATPIFLVRHQAQISAGETVVECELEDLPLPRGRFYLWTSISRDGADLIAWHPAATVDVLGPFLAEAPRAVVRLSPVHVPARWQVRS